MATRSPTRARRQLDHIRSAATLNNVSIGLIPADAEMQAVPWCGFTLYEDRADDQPPFVAIETAHAGLIVNDPEDIAIYRKQLELLRESAALATTPARCSPGLPRSSEPRNRRRR